MPALRLRTFAVIAVALGLLCVGGPVFAVHQTGVFELDGDTLPPAVAPPDDFDSVYLGTDHAYDHIFIDDSTQPDASVHFSGNKDEEAIGAWTCIVKSNVTDKLDIRHSYYAAYNVGGDAIAYVGADRDSVVGDANVGYWFFQDRVTCDPATGTFVGKKRDGDLLLVAPFTGGGTEATVDVYRWTDPTPASPESGDETLVPLTSGDCATTDKDACGLTNGSPISVAWETLRNPIPVNAFFEGGINLTALQPNTCYRTLMAESRSSQQLTASLEDFTLTEIFTCGSISVEKVTDPSGDLTLFDFDTAGQPANPSLPAVSDIFQLKDGDATHATLNLQPGTYSVTEGVVPAGWTLTGATCRGGAFGTGTVYNNGAPFPLAIGDKVVCTFVNTLQTPPPETAITVDKVTIPAGHPQLFGFAIAGAASDSFQLADADPSHTTSGLGAGQYTITETVPAGWDLTGIVCKGGTFGTGAPYTNGAPISLADGDKVVCTFTNTVRIPPPSTTITVAKVTIPSGSPQLFAFTTAGGPDPLSDSFALTDGQTHTTDVKPGLYTVTESVPAGWLPSASCAGGPFGAGAAYVNGDAFAVNEGDQVLCTFTNNFQVRPGGQNFCAKATVRDVLNPAGVRFKNNKGVDHVVFAHLGESIQTALDLVNDVNNDGYVIIGVVAANPVNGVSAYGGHVSQHFEINRAYAQPFALLGCSVTVHDDDRGNGLPTARITPAASNPSSSPANPTFTKQANIFVMDLHGADSEAPGWLVEGQGRELRNVNTSGSAIGLQISGNGNTIQNGVVQGNLGVGISVQGSGNVLNSVDSMANRGHGVQVTGNTNQLIKLDVGDIGKGNGGDGANVSGTGNTLSETSAFANTGHGVAVTGSNTQVLKAFAGDKNKGNGGDGIRVASPGNLIQENRASANRGDGINVSGGTSAAPNRLKNNQSNLGLSGSATENGGAEYRLSNAVTNYGGGNKADAILVPKTTVPVKCPTFPATNATVNFGSPTVCE